MRFEPMRRLRATTIVLPQENIDTDQIIPARFLTTTGTDALASCAFHDWRYDENGTLRADSPLPPEGAGTAQILVAGANFGCGSSREHAPWALRDYGFRAVVSPDIADIFKSNALKNGLIPVEIDPRQHRKLLARPGIEIVIDLETGTLESECGVRARFTIDPFGRRCLIEGIDPLGHILAQQGRIADYECTRA